MTCTTCGDEMYKLAEVGSDCWCITCGTVNAGVLWSEPPKLVRRVRQLVTMLEGSDPKIRASMMGLLRTLGLIEAVYKPEDRPKNP